MVNITLSIPEDLKQEMEKFPEMNWSAIAREAIKKRVLLLRELNKILSKSELTEEDAVILGRKVNKAVAKKLLKSY